MLREEIAGFHTQSLSKAVEGIEGNLGSGVGTHARDGSETHTGESSKLALADACTVQQVG